MLANGSTTESEFYDPYTYDLAIGASSKRSARKAFYAQLATKVGRTVVEMGCGTGEITLEIAKQGVPVLGIDRSQAMLDRCTAKLQTQDESIRRKVMLLHSDMLDWKVEEKEFGAVFLPYHLFFHILTQAEIIRLLRTLYVHLPSKAIVCLDVFFPDPEYLAKGCGDLPSPLVHIADTYDPAQETTYKVWRQHHYHPVSQILNETFRYELIDKGYNVLRTWYRQLIYRLASPVEIELYFQLTGWKTVEISRAFDGEKQLTAKDEYIVLAEKP